MFRLVRTLILVMFAFVAGMLFEREDRRGACQSENGDWRENTCFIEEIR